METSQEEKPQTKIELAVELTCQNCVTKTENVLSKVKGIEDFQVNLDKQSVVVTCSDLPSSKLVNIIETEVGKRAVIMGVGPSSSDQQKTAAAVAMLGGLIGCGLGNVQGVVRFTQATKNTCIIDGTIDGLSPGEHALAIHECGDLSGGCDTVGGHFNPRNTRHGSPVDSEEARHVGDLGNVIADEKGRAEFQFDDNLVKVNDIIGRSIVISNGSDDLGRGTSQMSKVNGNCGEALSCGIIARSAGIFENAKRICACDGVTLWDERNKPLVGPGRQQQRNKL